MRYACGVLALSGVLPLTAHELQGHRGPTYEVSAAAQIEEGQPHLKLSVIDRATGQPTPARFSLVVDGQAHTPSALGENGLRFVSIHVGKRQRFTALYTRGTGAVRVPLPAGNTSHCSLLCRAFCDTCPCGHGM